MPNVLCNLIGCCVVLCLRHSACFGGLSGANVLSYNIGEETDGQVKLGKPCVLSLSSTKLAADVCDFLRDRDKWYFPTLFLSPLLSWSFSVSLCFLFMIFYSLFLILIWRVSSLTLKTFLIPLFFLWSFPFHEFLFIFLLLHLLRQTSYAQKPWRIRWTQCGMKRWCIMASQQPTWPPKRSGRCSALN